MSMKLIRGVVCLTALCWMLFVAVDARAIPVSHKYVTVNGIRIFYREAGDPKKPTILLLHGFPSSSYMYAELIPLLSNHFHLLAPDYPGMGYSDAPSPDKFTPTFEGLAGVIAEFMEQLEEKRFIVYMQDFGGPVGMRLAVKHPGWIAGMIFQNTPVSLDGWEPTRLKAAQADAGPVTAEKRAEAESHANISRDIFLHQHGAHDPEGLNPDSWAVDAYALGIPEDKRIMADLLLDIPSNIAQYPTWQSYLQSHSPRTLIVWGKGDPIFVPAGAETIRRLVPNAEIHFYDSGHFALEEDCVDIAQQIIRVFAK